MKLIIYILIIYLITLIKNVKSDCSIIPFIQLKSQTSKCYSYDSVVIKNANQFSAISIDGVKSSVDYTDSSIYFNFNASGYYTLKYEYIDHADNRSVCIGSMGVKPRVVTLVYSQPQCPLSNVLVTVVDSTEGSYSMNEQSPVTNGTPLYTNIPGTNIVSTENCQYYFQVSPLSESVPLVSLSLAKCDTITNGHNITINNYNQYSSMQLISTNGVNGGVDGNRSYNAVNGVFYGLPTGQYVLVTESSVCGQQNMTLYLNQQGDTVYADYKPVEQGTQCNKDHLQVTLSMNRFPNAVFTMENGGTTTTTNGATSNSSTQFIGLQNSMVNVSWSDQVSGCSGTQQLYFPTLEMQVTIMVDPPTSTLSNPSIVTIIYNGNYSNLLVFNDQQTQIQLSGTSLNQFRIDPTSTTTNSFTIKSSCYLNSIDFTVPTLTPLFKAYSYPCFQGSTIQLINYKQFNNVTLISTNNSSLTYQINQSNNGLFKGIIGNSFYYFANEFNGSSNNNIGINQNGTFTFLPIDMNPLNITYLVKYNQLASTCKSKGTVTLLPMYNNGSQNAANGTTFTIEYSPSRSYQIPFNGQCPSFNWIAPINSFNLNYTITNATINSNATIKIMTNSSLFVSLTINSITYGSLNQIYDIMIGSNDISIQYNDGCNYTFNVISYGPNASIQPEIDILYQTCSNCAIACGGIRVINNNTYDYYKLIDYKGNEIHQLTGTLYGQWSGLSSQVYKLYYRGRGEQLVESIVIDIPTYGDVFITQMIVTPTCKSTVVVNQVSYDISDSIISFTMTNRSDMNNQVPITGFVKDYGQDSYHQLFTSTNQVIGFTPGLYTAYLQSFNCQWRTMFNINPVSSVSFPITKMYSNYSNSGCLLIGNPNGMEIDDIVCGHGHHDATNYMKLTGYTPDNGLTSDTVNVVYNGGICQIESQPQNVVFDNTPSFVYLPPTRCGTVRIQFNISTLQMYYVQVNNIYVVTTDPVEIPLGVTQFNFISYSDHSTTYSKSIDIQYPLILDQSEYQYLPATCLSSSNGKLIINNPRQHYTYLLVDTTNTQNIIYNNLTNSFNQLSNQFNYQLLIQLNNQINNQNNQNQSYCLISQLSIESVTPLSPISISSSYLEPNIIVTNACRGQIKGSVQLSLYNNQVGDITTNYSINGTYYTDLSPISMSQGIYELKIHSMTNQYCTLESIGKSYVFALQMAPPVSLSLLPSDTPCKVINLYSTGGDQFELYNNSVLIANQTSSTGFTTFNVSQPGDYKIISRSSSSQCPSPPLTLTIDNCLVVNHSNTSFIYNLLSILILSFILILII